MAMPAVCEIEDVNFSELTGGNARRSEDTRFSLIQLIHNGPDGYATFHRKGPLGNWHDIGAIPVDRLRSTLKRIDHHLESDSYFSINTMYRTTWELEQIAGRWRKRKRNSYNLPIPFRRIEGVRWLNAF